MLCDLKHGCSEHVKAGCIPWCALTGGWQMRICSIVAGTCHRHLPLCRLSSKPAYADQGPADPADGGHYSPDCQNTANPPSSQGLKLLLAGQSQTDVEEG